jgi:hypothetical protein
MHRPMHPRKNRIAARIAPSPARPLSRKISTLRYIRAGVETATAGHTFSATGITDYLKNGGVSGSRSASAGYSKAKGGRPRSTGAMTT